MEMEKYLNYLYLLKLMINYNINNLQIIQIVKLSFFCSIPQNLVPNHSRKQFDLTQDFILYYNRSNIFNCEKMSLKN